MAAARAREQELRADVEADLAPPEQFTTPKKRPAIATERDTRLLARLPVGREVPLFWNATIARFVIGPAMPSIGPL